MLVEFQLLDLDEIDFGLHMAYGEDENGSFHMITLGFIICSLNFIKYIKQ